MSRLEDLQQRFRAFSGRAGRVAFAPGRINLIGEHTDYSAGFVLPASLALGTLFSAIGLAAVAGPIWLAFHVGNLRRGHHAAIAGALAGSLMFIGARHYGLGLDGLPAAVDALLTWLILTGMAAATASIMWRIAYRRVG